MNAKEDTGPIYWVFMCEEGEPCGGMHDLLGGRFKTFRDALQFFEQCVVAKEPFYNPRGDIVSLDADSDLFIIASYGFWFQELDNEHVLGWRYFDRRFRELPTEHHVIPGVIDRMPMAISSQGCVEGEDNRERKKPEVARTEN